MVRSKGDELTRNQEALVDVLVSASRAMVALAARSLAEFDADLTLPQYRALVVLASKGSLRSADLAQELAVAPSTVTRLCDRLVRRGLITRLDRASDRRTVPLALTDAGRDLIGGVMRARRAEISRLVTAARVSGDDPAVEAIHSFVLAAGELPDPQWWDAWAASAIGVDNDWPGGARAERPGPAVA